jgi:hypothetical protein
MRFHFHSIQTGCGVHVTSFLYGKVIEARIMPHAVLAASCLIKYSDSFNFLSFLHEIMFLLGADRQQRKPHRISRIQGCPIRKYLQIPTVNEEISRFCSPYAVRLRAHTNELIATLTEPSIYKRLRRYWPNYLRTRL